MYTRSFGDELYHYGVLGMKWGVRKGTSELKRATKSGDGKSREHAINTLSKHQSKINKKITKLQKAETGLRKNANSASEKLDYKAAKLERKSAKYNRKAVSRFRNDAKTMKWQKKSAIFSEKSSKIKAKSAAAKSALEKNVHLQEVFKKGLSEVERELNSAKKK